MLYPIIVNLLSRDIGNYLVFNTLYTHDNILLRLKKPSKMFVFLSRRINIVDLIH